MKKQDQIWKYIRGLLTGREANRLEQEALSDPFLYEALEGFGQIDGKHEEVVGKLQKQIQRSIGQKRSSRIIRYAGIAAACILLAGVAGWWLYIPRDTLQMVQVVKDKTDTIHKIIIVERAESDVKKISEKRLSSKSIKKDSELSAETASHKTGADQGLVVAAQYHSPWNSLSRKASLSEKIEGIVTDENDASLAEAILTMERVQGGSVTDSGGYFQMHIPDSTQQLRVCVTGRQDHTLPGAEHGKLCNTLQEGRLGVEEGEGAANRDKVSKRNWKKDREAKAAFQEVQRDFAKYVADSLRYPEDARLLQLEGEVILGIYLNKKGHPSRIKLLQKLSRSCDREAIRLVEEFRGSWRTESRSFTVIVPFSLREIKN